MNNKNTNFKNLDQILKFIFDKNVEKKKIGLKELENFIKDKKVNQNLEKIIKSINKAILDKNLNYRNLILKGEFNFFYNLFFILNKFENIPNEIYFLIIQPLFEFIKENDNDIKIIIKCVNTLLSILKIKQNIYVNYFKEFFNILIVLKINLNQEIRICGNSIDEFLKECVGNYYQEYKINNNNNSLNIKNPIITIIEYILKTVEEIKHPSIQILIVSWINYLLCIQELKLIKYFNQIIFFLFRFLTNNISDVSQCTEQCLKRMIIWINENFNEKKKKNDEYLNKILEQILDLFSINKNINDNLVKICAFEWINMFLKNYIIIINNYLNLNEKLNSDDKINNNIIEISTNSVNENKSNNPEILIKNIPFNLFNKIISILIESKINTNFSKNNEDLFISCNENFQKILLTVPKEFLGNNIQLIEENFMMNLKINSKNVVLNFILDFIIKLFERFNITMFNDIYEFIKKLINILQYQNKELDDKILKIIGEIIKLKNKKFNQNIIINILDKFQNTNSLINNFGIHMLKYLSKIINITKIYNIFCDLLLKKDDLNFIIAMINILDIFLVVEEEGQKICLKIQKNKKFFKKIFTLWSYNPISTLIICLISNNYLLSFRLALELSKIELNQDELFQLCQLVQLLESSLFNNIRIKLLNPYKNIYLIKTLYVILMLLPLSQAYNSLNNRLSSLEIILDLDKNKLLKEIKSKDINDDNIMDENVEEYIKIFNSRQSAKNNN